MGHHIKSRLRAKPARQLRANGLISIFSLSIGDLDSLSTAPRRCGISEQLGVATLLEAREPEDTALNRSTTGQQPVVRENGSFLLPQRFGNVLSFLWSQHDAAEAVVERDVVVEGARVLRRDLQIAP